MKYQVAKWHSSRVTFTDFIPEKHMVKVYEPGSNSRKICTLRRAVLFNSGALVSFAVFVSAHIHCTQC